MHGSHLKGISFLHINTEDVLMTKQAVEVALILDIPLLDHIVVGRNEWISMKEKKLGFP